MVPNLLISFMGWIGNFSSTLLQIPPDIPNNSNALNIESASDIFLFIILPLLFIIIGTYWYYKKTTKKGSGQK
jgi:hypothetical protein